MPARYCSLHFTHRDSILTAPRGRHYCQPCFTDEKLRFKEEVYLRSQSWEGGNPDTQPQSPGFNLSVGCPVPRRVPEVEGGPRVSGQEGWLGFSKQR